MTQKKISHRRTVEINLHHRSEVTVNCFQPLIVILSSADMSWTFLIDSFHLTWTQNMAQCSCEEFLDSIHTHIALDRFSSERDKASFIVHFETTPLGWTSSNAQQPQHSIPLHHIPPRWVPCMWKPSKVQYPSHLNSFTFFGRFIEWMAFQWKLKPMRRFTWLNPNQS